MSSPGAATIVGSGATSHPSAAGAENIKPEEKYEELDTQRKSLSTCFSIGHSI